MGNEILTQNNVLEALFQGSIELLLGAIMVLLFGKRISRWWRRLNERAHSRMLDVVDFTQTIVEDNVLKVRTVSPTTIHDFTLRSEELTEVFGAAVQVSYHQDHVYVALPQNEESNFKKLRTIIYGHANTAFSREASWERFKPASSRLKTVTSSGRLVVYAEKDAEVSKVHVEFVPDALWNQLREPPLGRQEEWEDYHGIRPEGGRQHLLIRLKTLWEIKQAEGRFKADPQRGHLLVFRFDAEMVDHRATIADLLGESN